MKIHNSFINLKTLRNKDINYNYLKWFNNKDVYDYIDNIPKNLNDIKSQVKFIKNKKNSILYGIFYKNLHIGNLNVRDMDFKNSSATIGILIGNKKYRSKGISKIVFSILKKKFLKKKIYIFNLGVDKNNLRAVKAYKKSGFKVINNSKKILRMQYNYFKSKLILGGSQFNSNYGITNKKVQTTNEAKKILEFCKKNVIDHIDLAEKYIISKNIKILKKRIYKVDTKIFLDDINNKNLSKILYKKYKSFYLDTLFIHDGDNIVNNNNKYKIKILNVLKKKKIIKKIGISIYNVKLIPRLVKEFKFDVIQVPYNLLDRRIEKYQKYLEKKNIKIYARSIFLQGILLKDLKNSQIMSSIFNKIRKSKKYKNQTNLNMSLNFVYSNQYIDKILIGVKNLSELKKIFKTKLNFSINKIEFNKKEIKFAEDPRRWS